ncbi:MAG: M14 family metallopeptidase [Anaerostipes sp.]|nr:M14 family metallopeptidase [Anaerostipes sp.]MDD3747556.1 M14 family metallopeptidase [Anaerostipes sp.]
MIETVVSVQLPIREKLRIKKNSLSPDELTGSEKRMCLVSGVYGDELGGQYICGEVIRRIKKDYDNLKGIVDVYPSINPLGLDARTRIVPISEIDYNTAFPGDANGEFTEYTAFKLIEDIRGADFCIDIHSSNIFLQELPQVRINDVENKELLRLAHCMNTDLVWIHPSTTVNEGSLPYHLNEIGVPTIVSESGTAFNIKYDYCEQIIEGIFSVMKELGIWSGETIASKKVPTVYDQEIIYLNCESSGLFVANKMLNERVEEGDVIGSIMNPILGAIEEDIIAPIGGIIMTLREHPGVTEGSLVARILGGAGE